MTLARQLAKVRIDAEEIFSQIRRGIEKESLRITRDGHLSQKPHPKELGSALTHPFITTDYSEALIELVTPTFFSLDQVLDHLEQLHGIVYRHIGGELLWVNSLPCLIDEEDAIPIAGFGTSNIGQMKHIYRRGLDIRYGRKMQIIAGIHYNISVPDLFWKVLGIARTAAQHKDVSNSYMAGIRNFHRHCWLLFYLFGSSPAACRSFFPGTQSCGLSTFDSHTVYARHGTSLRMSNYGYRNPVQSEIRINQNSVDAYIETLSKTISTPFPTYEKYGVKSDAGYIQLNTNLLQIENEYYSVIRPKRRTSPMEKPTHALRDRGVEYLEIRCMDLDPYESTGISQVQARFLDLFITYCLLCPSPPILNRHYPIISANKDAAVLNGRDPDLVLKRNGERITLKSWGSQILDELEPIAELFDRALDTDSYRRCIRLQKDKIDHPEKTPSARILNELMENDEPFFHFAVRKAKEAKKAISNKKLSPETINHYNDVALESLQRQSEMEEKDSVGFDDFLKWYFSQ